MACSVSLGRALLVVGVALTFGCEGETTLRRVGANGFFDPPALEFGTRNVGLVHELRTELRNTSADQLRVSEVRFEPNTDVYAARRADGGTLRGTTLERGALLEIALIYAPASEGDFATTMILVADNLELEIELEISARARRVAPARPVTFPSTVSFFGVEVGRDVMQVVTVENGGETDGTVTVVDSRAPFSFRAVGGGPLTLPSPLLTPGASLQVEVHYRPDAAGPVTRDLQLIFDTGEKATLPVSGDAVAAGVLDCEPRSIAFGPVARGLTAQQRVVCSVSGGPYTLASARLAPGSSSSFTVPNLPSAVGEGGVVAFDVEFQSVGLPAPHGAAVELLAAHEVRTTVNLTAETAPPVPGSTDLSAHLTWNTAYSDFDLHLVRVPSTLFDAVGDCHFANKNPDWGTSDYGGDDPFLDRDDTDGFGPEEVNLTFAAEGAYDLYVQYYAYTGSTPPPTTLTLDYQLRGAASGRIEVDMYECGLTWYVGRVFFDGNTPRFSPGGAITTTWRSRASERCR